MTAKLDATGQGWVAKLANYNFSLHYQSEKSNIKADALCRIPWDRRYEIFDETVDESSVKDIVCVSSVNNHSNTAAEFSHILYPEPGASILSGAGHSTPAAMMNKDWIKEQMQDPIIGEICKHLLEGTLHKRKSKRGDPDPLKNLLKYRHQLILRNNLLYRKIRLPKAGNPIIQFVLPSKFREHALEACHNEIGHLGLERSLDLLRDQFFWASMGIYMEKKIKNCDRCLCFKARPQKTSLCPLKIMHPLELVHMDFLKIELNQTDKDVHILIVTDHFT